MEVKVKDLGFSAFLLLKKDGKVSKSPYIDYRGTFHFSIFLPDSVIDKEEDLEKLEQEYMDSDFKQFDQLIKWLKKSLKRPRNRYHRRYRRYNNNNQSSSPSNSEQPNNN